MVDLGVEPGRLRRVTAILLGRVGDVIVATPFLKSLACRFPRADLRLVLNASCSGLVEMLSPNGGAIPKDQAAFVRPWYRAPQNLGALQFVAAGSELVVDLNPSFSKSAAALTALAQAPVKLGFIKGRLDWVFTHQVAAAGAKEPMLARYARLAEALGAPYDPQTRLSVPSWRKEKAAPLLRGAGFDPRQTNLAIHPGNFKKYDNRWPEENFVALADRLLEDPSISLYFLAGPGERSAVQAIASALKRPAPLLPPASLSDTAAMLTSMDALICNITGTTHLAAAVGVPTFGLYSGYTDAVWRPADPRCGGVAATSWESCRGIAVEEAFLGLKDFLTRINTR